MQNNPTAIVIGAGITGLATARALAVKGYKVTVIERTEKATGASIRNFGMLWPIGQPDGALYDRAMRSKMIWQEIADKTKMWYDPCGSLHVATKPDEFDVLHELNNAFATVGRPSRLMSQSEIRKAYPGLNHGNILYGLFSPTETIIDPREAIVKVTAYLTKHKGISFLWQRNVTAVATNKVYMGKEMMQADLVFVCSGADHETLYPELFRSLPVTRCKLQMMRYNPGPAEPRIGTAVCGGLSLIHYKSFQVAKSLPALRERYEKDMAQYIQWGIHVMISQNQANELTVGDSHEYGNHFEPFDKAFINRLVMTYLKEFAVCDNWELVQSWNGIYPKMTNDETEIFLSPDPGVYILNGVGGTGMTVSFGLAEEKINSLF